VSLFTLLLTIWYPPEFPELPQWYSEWKEFANVLSCPLDPFFRNDCFNGKDIERDSSLVPYFMSSNKTCGYSNDATGVVKHYSSTSDNIWVDVPNDYTLIFWHPHPETDSLDPRPLYSYDGYISYDTMGFEKITIDNREAWRIRGKWWWVTCDGYVHVSGSFTNYFIPTEKLDYRITCLSRFYLNSQMGPDPSGIEHYPDRIAELEQAVEQTFKPKEEILQPIADTHIFLGPPLPAGYSNWRKRLTLCNEERKLSYFAYMGTVSTTEIQPLPFFFEGLVTQPGLICGDSLRGSVILPLESDSIPQVMHVYLRPAGELSLDVANVKSELISLSARPEDFISLDRAGVEELSINGNRAFRLRTWQYGPADKELSATTSSVTAYLIHSQKSDYIVICSNCLYKSAGLTKNGQERFYPDRIAELEQAVEKTFRPK